MTQSDNLEIEELHLTYNIQIKCFLTKRTCDILLSGKSLAPQLRKYNLEGRRNARKDPDE